MRRLKNLYQRAARFLDNFPHRLFFGVDRDKCEMCAAMKEKA